MLGGKNMDYMEMMRQQDAGRVALIEDGVEYTYGRLVELAEEMAGNAALFTKRADLSRQQQVHLIRQKTILRQLTEFLATMAYGMVPVIVPGDAKALPEDLSVLGNVGIHPAICMGVMTSGTTGIPKLLFRTYESWAGFFPIQNRIFGIDRDSRIFMQGSLAFTGNLNLYLAQFSVGGTVVAQNLFQPKKWQEIFQDSRADSIYLIPSKLMCMPKVIEETFPNVKTILSGSQSLGREDAGLLQKIFPNARIILYYGASELNYITYVTDAQMTGERDLVGWPFPGVEVTVRGQEIYVDTPYHVEGIACPYTLSDCGYFDEEGGLHFSGRSDDIVQIHGRKISTFHIEEVLRSQPEIAAAAVLALPVCKQHGQEDTGDNSENGYVGSRQLVLTAFVVLADQQAISKLFMKKLRKRLAHYEMPGKFVEIEKLPKKENGKLDKTELRRLYKMMLR